ADPVDEMQNRREDDLQDPVGHAFPPDGLGPCADALTLRSPPRPGTAPTGAWSQPSFVSALRIPRMAWPMRCSFSTSAKRTNPSPPGPKPTPGEMATPASGTSILANSRLPISSYGSGIGAQ